MSRLSNYSFINANLRAKISKIIDDNFLNKLIESPTVESALYLLKETDYEFLISLYEDTADLRSCEIALFERDIQIHRDVIKKMGNSTKVFSQSLTLFYEIAVLKQAMRLWFDRVIKGRDINKNSIYLYRDVIVNRLPIDLIINSENYNSMIESLKGLRYYNILNKINLDGDKITSIYKLEFELDKYYFKNLLEESKNLSEKDRKVVVQYLSAIIDIENLNRIFRMRYYYDFPIEEIKENLFDGGKKITPDCRLLNDENFNIFEFVQTEMPEYIPVIGQNTSLKVLDLIINELKKRFVSKILLGEPWTIGIILAYFIKKKEEINNLITILNAKEYNLDYNRIKEIL